MPDTVQHRAQVSLISRRMLCSGFAALAAVAKRTGATVPARIDAAPHADIGPPDMRFSYVVGAGGVPLSVAQTGDPRSAGILFLHGLGQSHLSFALQLHSSLAQRFHLVAFDLRGHGNSGKPWDPEAYSDSGRWADDVARVIAATGLERPVIVAWSYGTLVAGDYLRHLGSAGLSGIVMIGALGGLATLPLAALDPAYMAKLQRLHQLNASPGLENTLAASHDIVPLLTARPMPAAWTAMAETVNAMVPPFARSVMGARLSTDNKDLIPQIRVPMMLLAGSEDRGTPRSLMQSLADSLPAHTQVSVYDGSGHSAFAEEPVRFNRDLEAFATRAFSPAA
jgi:non-heme chloroperoxidase